MLKLAGHSWAHEAPLLEWKTIPSNARDNIRMIGEWLQICLQKHRKCRVFQWDSLIHRERPTRLLDLANDSIRLECYTQGIDALELEYVTLSHMWGEKAERQVRLVQSRVAEFQEQIPYEELSFIYKEAIRITRLLGYRYIWIDSLSIIQDSKTDWDTEAQKMASVYVNSICNISYIFPPDYGPPKQRKDPRRWSPCVLRPDTGAGKWIYIQHKFPDVEWLKTENWPLLKRAWVFQERLLCPRNLYFGNESLVWECWEHYCDELIGPISWSVANFEEKKLVIKSDLHLTLSNLPQPRDNMMMDRKNNVPELRDFVYMWSDIVNEYRMKMLSHRKDRCIALAGIGIGVRNVTNFQYVAGLWEEVFQPLLLWARPNDANIEAPTGDPEPNTESAPSWSWFSVEIPYKHRKLEWPTNRLLLYSDNSMRRLKNLYWAKVVSFGRDPPLAEKDARASFHNFSGQQVEVDCRIMSASLIRNERGQVEMRFVGLDEEDIVTEYYHDHRDLDEDFPIGVVVALVAEFRRYVKPIRSAEGLVPVVEHYLSGLALAPLEDREEGRYWRRLGMWVVTVMIDDPELTNYDAPPLFRKFGDWERKNIVMV